MSDGSCLSFLPPTSMSSVRFKDLTTRFSVKRDFECPSVFENLKLQIAHRTLGPVAKLSAVKIIRSHCRGSFLETLDAHSEDLHHFSVELFDNYGRVYPWLFESGNRRIINFLPEGNDSGDFGDGDDEDGFDDFF